ncbi:MAG: PIN domain-containing protein [bacterium]|nr:PIN domain-containing protein [bacterium]
MILLDTSFLYAFFQKNDVHHKKAVELAGQKELNAPIIPIEVFEELMTVITSRKSSQEAIKTGNFLFSEESPVEVKEEHTPFEKVWQEFQQLSPHDLSYTDCVLITEAKRFGCDVLTFDKNILRTLNH